MKSVFNILLILSSLLLIECNSSETKKTDNKGCDSLLIGRPTKEIDIPIFYIDTCFNKYLDTIINEEINCTFFDSCQSCFSYYMMDYMCVSDKSQSISPADVIYISSENIYAYDYSKCYGIFEYKGFRFICDSFCNKSFLRKTNNTRHIKYLLLDKKREPEIDDRWSDWRFIFKKDKLQLFEHHPYYKGNQRYPLLKKDE